jgi:hypothetical protein
MKNLKNNPFWDELEIRLIRERELFLNKPGIMKKANDSLESLKNKLVAQLANDGRNYPEGSDLIKGQIAKGENHNGFPFISLDMPQKFSKTEMFTFRTLFWWGHYLGFSLILKGMEFNNFAKKLSERKDSELLMDIYFATSSNIWEWGKTKENFKLVSESSSVSILQTVSKINYIKLIRFYPITDPSFDCLDWEGAGAVTFENFMKIIKD